MFQKMTRKKRIKLIEIQICWRTPPTVATVRVIHWRRPSYLLSGGRWTLTERNPDWSTSMGWGYVSQPQVSSVDFRDLWIEVRSLPRILISENIAYLLLCWLSNSILGGSEIYPFLFWEQWYCFLLPLLQSFLFKSVTGYAWNQMNCMRTNICRNYFVIKDQQIYGLFNVIH